MELFDFVVAAAAGCQIVEVIHHGSIFKPLRDWAEKQTDCPYPERWLVGKLISCPFCLSHWAAAAVILLVLLAALPYCPGILLRFPLYALAATRAANLLNDLTHAWNRSPREYEEVDQTKETDKSRDAAVLTN